MKEFLEYSVDEVAATLHMLSKTIQRLNGEVKAENLGRPIHVSSFKMDPHIEFVIMEAVLSIMPFEIVTYMYDFLFFRAPFSETAVYVISGATLLIEMCSRKKCVSQKESSEKHSFI